MMTILVLGLDACMTIHHNALSINRPVRTNRSFNTVMHKQTFAY